jgi:ribosomal protein L7Ae-like RNA K-turn-binding protein
VCTKAENCIAGEKAYLAHLAHLAGCAFCNRSQIPTVIYKNMFNLDASMGIFYSKTMISYLSTIVREHEHGVIRRKLNWANVQNVEQTFQSQRNLGKWLGAQTNQESVCNLKSGFLNAQSAKLLSVKC